jgi:hypothetical protein
MRVFEEGLAPRVCLDETRSHAISGLEWMPPWRPGRSDGAAGTCGPDPLPGASPQSSILTRLALIAVQRGGIRPSASRT